MIKPLYVSLNAGQFIAHYFLVLVVLLFPVILGILVLLEDFSGSEKAITMLYYLAAVCVVCFPLSAFFYIKLRNPLLYTRVDVVCSDAEFITAFKQTAALYDWTVEECNGTHARAIGTGYDFDKKISSFQMITALRLPDSVLINSTAEPGISDGVLNKKCSAYITSILAHNFERSNKGIAIIKVEDKSKTDAVKSSLFFRSIAISLGVPLLIFTFLLLLYIIKTILHF